MCELRSATLQFLSCCVVEHWSSVAQEGPHTWSLSSSGTTRLKNGESKAQTFFFSGLKLYKQMLLRLMKSLKSCHFLQFAPQKSSSTVPNIWIKCCCSWQQWVICVCVYLPFSLFGSIQEEVVKDAESVRNQQQQHLQQHSCTLDECFQLYTKEEQVSFTFNKQATKCFSQIRNLIISLSWHWNQL